MRHVDFSLKSDSTECRVSMALDNDSSGGGIAIESKSVNSNWTDGDGIRLNAEGLSWEGILAFCDHASELIGFNFRDAAIGAVGAPQTDFKFKVHTPISVTTETVKTPTLQEAWGVLIERIVAAGPPLASVFNIEYVNDVELNLSEQRK